MSRRRRIEDKSVGTQGCVSHEARAQDDAHRNLPDNRGLMESSKEKMAPGGQQQKNRKLLEKGLRFRGRHSPSANGLGLLMNERQKRPRWSNFHPQTFRRGPAEVAARLRKALDEVEAEYGDASGGLVPHGR